MTAPLNSQDLIKQPRPSTMDKSSAAKKDTASENQNVQSQIVPQKKFNRPNVGVVSPSSISQTPLADTITIKKKENPYIKYKIMPRIKIKSNFQKFASIGVIVAGIYAFASEFLKKKP